MKSILYIYIYITFEGNLVQITNVNNKNKNSEVDTIRVFDVHSTNFNLECI